MGIPEIIEQHAQFVSEGEHALSLILRRARIEPDFALLAIDVPPLDRQDFALDAQPEMYANVTTGRRSAGSCASTAANISSSKNPDLTLRSCSIGILGIRPWYLSPSTASRNARFTIASSRLISAGEAPASSRRAVNARRSAVVMLLSRRPPSAGVRCNLIRRSTSAVDFLPLTV
jgi:hypothetical protein